MSPFTDPPAFLAAKATLRHDYEAWKASFTADEWRARMDATYGPRDSDGRRQIRIEFK